MNACADPLRVVYARWSLLAAAEPVLAAAGAPLPFRVTVDGTGEGVARYDASSTGGATLARFPGDRAVLSCGDAAWRIPGGASASELLRRGPSWADHATMLDHRVRAGRFGWAAFWCDGAWAGDLPPAAAPLPPIGSTAATAAALAARIDGAGWADTATHLVRMCEYEWLDAASWRAAFGSLVAERVLDESWSQLVGFGLTQWSGSGPRTQGVAGRTPEEAVALAVECARREGLRIPDEVRVDSAMRGRRGWRVRFLDYRDAQTARPTVFEVPDEGTVRSLRTTPGR